MKKILIIDDEPQILLICGTRLKANGYQVVTAISGEQGLEKAREEKPDLVLLDHLMPEMDGMEVLERMKQDPETRGIPVVIFTANVKEVKVGDAQMRGAEDCFFKPFTSQELLSKVKEILDKYQ